MLLAPVADMIAVVDKPTQNRFADPSGLRTITLKALARELNKGGEQAFRRRYPGPFLLVAYTPSTNPGLSEHTIWTRRDMHRSSNPPNPETRAIPLLEAARPRNRITVGRGEENDIVIRGSGISKTHAAFLPGEDGGFRLMDMGSANGTAINGERLMDKRPVRLRNGDLVSFWWFQFEFVEQDFVLRAIEPYL